MTYHQKSIYTIFFGRSIQNAKEFDYRFYLYGQGYDAKNINNNDKVLTSICSGGVAPSQKVADKKTGENSKNSNETGTGIKFYEERLREMQMMTIEERRERGDFIVIFRLVKHMDKVDNENYL